MKTHAPLIVLIALIALLASCSSPWTRNDTYRQTAVVAVIAADWLQTRQIAGHPDQWEEHNTFLGNHPNRARVDVYFLSSAILNTAFAAFLPNGWRDAWQYFSIGYEAAYVRSNYRLGIRP